MPAVIDIDEKRKKKQTEFSQNVSESTSTTKQESQTGAVLDTDLLNTILAGLPPQMTDAEIAAFAESLLKPQLNAGLEASKQNLASTRLGLEQEKENLASELARAITEQQNAYRKSVSDVGAAALARGMGRSSYALQTMAGQGTALAETVRQLTDESARKSAQLQDRITLAEQQAAQTEGRLNTDYAANLAAKIQELRQNQQRDYSGNYMTAVSASMGSKTTGGSTTTGSESGMSVSGKIEKNEKAKSSSSSSNKSGSSTSGGYDHL